MKSSQILIIVTCLTFLYNCKRDRTYSYESIKDKVTPFLHRDLGNIFQDSDTLIIYDTTYFKSAIQILGQYANHLEPKDSAINLQIINRLQEIEKEQIQATNPDIYLSAQSIIDNINESKNTKKIIRFLQAYPNQIDAAKSQLSKPNVQHTKATIQQLSELYILISNDLINYSKEGNTLINDQKTILNAQLTIKDYIAFLNSKLLNGEVD